MLSTAQDGKVLAIWREPFKLGSPIVEAWKPGLSIAEIINLMSCLPDDFDEFGVVQVNQIEVPRTMWHLVRPKANSIDKPCAVTFFAPPQGKSGGGGKGIFGMIAALALTVLSAGIAGGLAVPLLGASFAAGTVGATLLAAGVSLVGALVVGALSSTPAAASAGSDTTSNGGTTVDAGSVSGNTLEPNSPIPRVIGTRRIYPSFLFEPVTEIIGQDEFVDAVYGLAGPHRLNDVRLNNSNVSPDENDADVIIQTSEGLPDSPILSIPDRYGRTFPINTEMSVHGTDAVDLSVFAPPLPVFHAMSTAEDPDEAWLHMLVVGLIKQDATTESLRIPMRIRMRRRGDLNWRYLPEIHYMDKTQSQRRIQIKFRFGETMTDTPPNPPSSRGFIEARKLVPAQTVNPVGTVWNSDAYFSKGSGNDIYRFGTSTTTNVINMTLEPDTVTFYLSTADWPIGIYDIEIKRGATFQNSNFNSNAYTYSGSVIDFYTSQSSGLLPMTRDGLLDRVNLVRVVSVKRKSPLNQRNLSLIYMRVRNRSINNLSVLASGYVYDYQKYGYPNVTPTFIDPMSINAYSSGIFTQDASFEADVILPRVVSDGVLWFAGSAAPYGAGMYLVSSGTTLRIMAGDATNAAPSGYVRLDIPVANLPFDGRKHRITWDIRINPGRIRFWCDGILIGTASIAGSITAWGGSVLDIGYLKLDAAIAPGLSVTRSDWTADASLYSRLRMYVGLIDTMQGGWWLLTTTSNPATHYRDILTGSLNLDPLPDDLVDEAAILEWWQDNETNGYTCDLVTEGASVDELMRLVASCGFARPYQSEVWGIIRDYDRSAEAPVQIFTPRNTNSFRWKKAFPRLPAGLRVNFKDQDYEYSGKQIVVYRNGASESDGRTEQISYLGIVDRDKAQARARFDLLQAEYRATLYTFNAPAENIVCRRGSLVALNHDVISHHDMSARIDTVIVNGSNDVTGIVLDSSINVLNSSDVLSIANVLAVTDMLEIGLNTAIAIRRTNGETTIHRISNAAGETDTLTFTAPIVNPSGPTSIFDPSPIKQISTGCLVVAGVLGTEYKRMIVSDIQPGKKLTATLTLVDEAPEIWS